MSNQQHGHNGHRARLKKRFLRDMGESMEPHELLELLLFFAIPRRNTNNMAHALLARFGTLDGVIRAPVEDLMELDGIGESAAIYLKCLWAASRQMELDARKDSPTYSDRASVEAYIKPLFARLTKERLYMLSFDGANRLLGCDLIAEGSTNAVAVNTPVMMRYLVRYSPSSVVLAHNHPNRSLLPSMEDVATTSYYQDLFQKMNVTLTQHFIVVEDQITSILTW